MRRVDVDLPVSAAQGRVKTSIRVDEYTWLKFQGRVKELGLSTCFVLEQLMRMWTFSGSDLVPGKGWIAAPFPTVVIVGPVRANRVRALLSPRNAGQGAAPTRELWGGASSEVSAGAGLRSGGRGEGVHGELLRVWGASAFR